MIPTGLPHQFLCYVRTAEGQKFPCNARGEAVDAHDPRNWMTYDQAAAAAVAMIAAAAKSGLTTIYKRDIGQNDCPVSAKGGQQKQFCWYFFY